MTSEREDTMDDEYVICPHCGSQRGDCWEWVKADESEEECPQCGNDYVCWAEYAVTYHASAIAAGSRRAKTPQAVECAASQSGPSGIAQKEAP